MEWNFEYNTCNCNVRSSEGHPTSSQISSSCRTVDAVKSSNESCNALAGVLLTLPPARAEEMAEMGRVRNTDDGVVARGWRLLALCVREEVRSTEEEGVISSLWLSGAVMIREGIGETFSDETTPEAIALIPAAAKLRLSPLFRSIIRG